MITVDDVPADSQALAAFFAERMDTAADAVLADLVAKVTADDADKDRLIADLAFAVRTLYEGDAIDYEVNPRLHRAVSFALTES